MAMTSDERAGRALAAWEVGLDDCDGVERYGVAGAAERWDTIERVWPSKVEQALAIYAAGPNAQWPAVQGGDRADAFDVIAKAIHTPA